MNDKKQWDGEINIYVRGYCDAFCDFDVSIYLEDVSGVLTGAKNCLEFMQAKGHDVIDHAKEGKNFKIFRQRGAHIFKMIYQKVP